MVMQETKRRVVVVGGGFGGLAFCEHFQKVDAVISLVDRRNHHLFQPLLYFGHPAWEQFAPGLKSVNDAPISAINFSWLSKRRKIKKIRPNEIG